MPDNSALYSMDFLLRNILHLHFIKRRKRSGLKLNWSV
uniref:Uncharacterized protein n=1 Tax=Anguilla anguilla TaxID=7936 RepID=A0A0E9QKC2_ANGAN